MYSMAKLCCKRVSTLNVAVYTWLHHESSVHSSFFSVCILMSIRPFTMNNAACNIVGEKFRGNEINSVNKHALRVLLH